MPPGTVIRSFAAPALLPNGLTWDGRALWLSDSQVDLIHQIDPITGTVIRSFASPNTEPRGLAWDGRALWHIDNTTDLIYQIDPNTGTVIRSFASNVTAPSGMTWDGYNLWCADDNLNRIHQVDPATGTTIRSFASPSTVPGGLAWDGCYLWHTDRNSDRIYQIDPDVGTVLRSFAAPGGATRMLTWDGRTLWCGDSGSDLIYQLSVTPGASYADRVLATGPIAYWPGWEATGTIAFDISGNSPLSEQDGAYTGVTLAQVGIGDGRTSGLYDGANDFTNIFTAAFDAAFNGAEGTVLCWGRVANAGVWTDGSVRTIISLLADNNNNVWLRKHSVNNTLRLAYEAGGVLELHTVAFSSTDWFQVAVTWSKPAEQAIFYLNGVQDGAIEVALGVWVGNLSNTQTLIGASTVAPLQVWDGFLAHAAVWNRALSPATMLSLGVL